MFQARVNSAERNKPTTTEYSTFKNRGLQFQKNDRSISRAKINFSSPPNGEGRIAVYGDSNCLDSTHLEKACYWLLNIFLDFAINSHKSSLLQNLNRIDEFSRVNGTPSPLRTSSNRTNPVSQIKACEDIDWSIPTEDNKVEHREPSIHDVVTSKNEGIVV